MLYPSLETQQPKRAELRRLPWRYPGVGASGELPFQEFTGQIAANGQGFQVVPSGDFDTIYVATGSADSSHTLGVQWGLQRVDNGLCGAPSAAAYSQSFSAPHGLARINTPYGVLPFVLFPIGATNPLAFRAWCVSLRRRASYGGASTVVKTVAPSVLIGTLQAFDHYNRGAFGAVTDTGNAYGFSTVNHPTTAANQAHSSSTAPIAYVWIDTAHGDGSIQISILNGITLPGIIFRRADANNYMTLKPDDFSDGWSLMQVVGGVSTLIGKTKGFYPQIGDLLLTFQGSIINAYFGGVPFLRLDEQASPSGLAHNTQHGIYLTAGGQAWDDALWYW